MMPKKVCNWPGCPRLHNNQGAYCDEHQRAKWRQREATRKRDRGAEYGGDWQSKRRQVLTEEPYCSVCGRPFGPHLPPDVHHLVPVARGGSNDRENLRAICRPCHAKISAQSRKARPGGY